MVSLSVLMVTSILTVPDNTVLLEFSSPSCHYCRVMQTTVDRLQENGYPVRVVNVEREPELARRFRARFLPTFILVSEGREVARHEGATSYLRLTGMFDQLNSPQSTADRTPGRTGATVRGQTPTAILPSLPIPKLRRSVDKPTPPSAARVPQLVDRSLSTGGNRTSGTTGQQLGPEQRALRATVRLKVIENGGHSFGTGTIVDTHGDYALVITCGHLFRGPGKNARVEVELFDQQGVHRTVVGKVITFDADERDIGLVEIQPGVPVHSVAVANDVQVVQKGRSVFSIGCDHGADPSLIRSQITFIDKYLGFPNIEVAGQPVVGRSGGGLFSADGQLIGICNLADPEDDEGIYAGLPMIHEELATVGITVQARPIAVANGLHPRLDADQTAQPTVRVPARRSDPINVPPVGVSQVICIVRTSENPQGELVVIDNPSPELLANIRRTSTTRTANLDDDWRPVRH